MPPGYVGQVALDHAQEWLDSSVDHDIITLNVETLTDTATNPNVDSLFPIADRLNWNLIRFGQRTRSNLRGWWVSGIDPFTWERMEWGRFKPDANTPILDRGKNKPAKYLSPSLGSGSSRLTLLDVPRSIWEQVAHRYQVAIEPDERAKGFWYWVWKHQIPLILTEGEKKAGCLLTLGYAAIALPGIFNGYRKETQTLIAELEFFAQLNRPVYICFDYETKANVLRNVNLAIAKLGRLLTRSGCETKVICLPGPQKGVDDFVGAHDKTAFDGLYNDALGLSFWQASQLWVLTYPAALTLNQRYLGSLPFPASGLACVRSAKGTGKTAALEPLIHEAMRQGRRVLVLTHRIQLGRAICGRLGLDWIEEVQESETQGLLGFGLCVDSLHARSQARFNFQEWRGAILILDECEQVIWHALNSTTCYEHRVTILETLKCLVQTVLSTEGLIIAQDADLSDLSVDYLKGLAEVAIEPWVVENRWRPTGWQVFSYDTPNPTPLLVRLEQVIQTGAVFIALDSQKVKGQWSSKNLETYLQHQFPHKRILRIDSESVANPECPAFGIVEHINSVVQNYDIVLATPTIGTGVSIDVHDHFKAVFGIFQGAIPDAEVRQAIARVREPVPRYLWAAHFGPGKMGNGSCSYQDVAASTTKGIRYNIALLKELDFDLDQQSDPITLRTWAKMAARVNISMWNYREELWQALRLEGHHLTIVTGDLDRLLPLAIAVLDESHFKVLDRDVIAKTALHHLSNGELTLAGYEFLQQHHDLTLIEQTKVAIGTIRQSNQQQEAIAVSIAPDIPAAEYDSLKSQRVKTLQDRYIERKHELQKRYIISVTPELKLKDDEGWYSQLLLHYYLTHDPEFVRLRDLKEWQGHLARGAGHVALQDIRLLSAQVKALHELGILTLLDSAREVKAIDPDVQHIEDCCKRCNHDIKTLFNLTISEKMTPIEVVQALLGKLGLKLTCIRRAQAADGRRGGLRIYQHQAPIDNRHSIFAQWQQRDQLATESLEITSIAQVDPPLDIDNLYQLLPGSANVTEQKIARSQNAAGLPLAIGSVVRIKQQVGEWVVAWVGIATARLRQIDSALERVVAWDESTLVQVVDSS